MIAVDLKEGYEEYDIQYPIIVSDVEEILSTPEYSLEKLQSYHHRFSSLKNMVPQSEQFISETIASGTRFGDYDVVVGIFSAKNYNDFLGKLVNRIMQHTSRDSL